MKKENSRVIKKCEICGKEMRLKPSSQQRFCSNECQHKWQKTNTGFNNPKFQGGYLTCENCGKEFLVNADRLKRKTHHFCSTECRQYWYSTVWSQTDEWRTSCKNRGASLLINNTMVTQTRPQIIINLLLDEMNIRYTNEQVFDFYSVDNYLNDYNLIIEIMGDYWHSSPLKYSYDTLNLTQKSIIPRDKAKHTFLYNKYNIEILYLWEKDILTDVKLCEVLIRKYVNNNGYLNNYNSFNYTIYENTLKLNDVIIRSLQESLVS